MGRGFGEHRNPAMMVFHTELSYNDIHCPCRQL